MNESTEILNKEGYKKLLDSQDQGDNQLTEANYGYVAIKYFLGIGIFGLIGVAIAILSIFIQSILGTLLLIVGIIIGIVGCYIALAYIPLYFLILKPRKIRNLWEKIAKSENLMDSKLILDIGCGTGEVSINVAKSIPEAKIIGIDIFHGVSGNSPLIAYKNAKAENIFDRVEFQTGNLMKIPFPDNRFDLVTAGSVLHEIHKDEDKIKAIQEIYRVLKSGGKFINVELIQNGKMYLFLLLFAFVWRSAKFWKLLYMKTNFKEPKVMKIKGFIDLYLYISQKN